MAHYKQKPFKFSIKPKDQDVPTGTATCDKGHKFQIANFHLWTKNNKEQYVVMGFCWECRNSVRVLCDKAPENATRDYRPHSFIEGRSDSGKD